MGISIRSELQQPRKCKATEKACENDDKKQNKVKKHMKAHPKPQKLRTPLPSRSPSPDVDEPASELEAKQPIDVSNFPYTLQTLCILGNKQVHADSDILKLGEFHFLTFFQQCIRKLENFIKNTSHDFQYIDGVVVMSAKSVTKANCLNIEVNDNHEWTKVERFIKTWMESKKADIVVKLTINYKKARDDDSDLYGVQKGVGKVVPFSLLMTMNITNCRTQQLE